MIQTKNNPSSLTSRLILSGLTLILISTLCFGLLLVKDLQAPLMGSGDIEQWEYTGFYTAKNFSLLPLPHIHLTTNQTFYPYGVNAVFQPWSFERDLFYATFFLLFGVGPWIKIYYLITLFVTAAGSFLLLLRDYGFLRSCVFGLVVTFFNFYGVVIYPELLSYAILHWTVLSFVADFLLVKRVVNQQPISLRLLLIRLCLLVLCLGQELGYIAGFALLSLTVSWLFIFLIVGYRYFTEKEIIFAGLPISEIPQYCWSEFNQHRLVSSALIGVFVVFGFINIPLLVEIYVAAKSFDFSGLVVGIWWMHPARLFLPIFPFFNSYLLYDPLKSALQDLPEARFAWVNGTSGWFFLAIGSLGIWQSRRSLLPLIPVILIFWLCYLYVPVEMLFYSEYSWIINRRIIVKLAYLAVAIGLVWLTRKKPLFAWATVASLSIIFFGLLASLNFPTLNIFPWFSFHRVAGRNTLIYAIIASLAALNIDLSIFSPRSRQAIAGLITLVFCLESYTIYNFHLTNYQPFIPGSDFYEYMNYVKQQPGEAVLDWPFCLTGGNSLGTRQGLCPVQSLTITYALRRFHQKKVVGQYFGRIHPFQLEAHIQAGWPLLLAGRSLPEATVPQLKRCFNTAQWEFFTQFYEMNDFVGINLYRDLIPVHCIDEFYRRFGQPIIQTVVPDAGRVEFIPKTNLQRQKVNLEEGLRLKYVDSAR